MYTLQQIEQVAIAVFADVSDVNDRPSQLRMRAITEIYAGMLASGTTRIDEEVLDANVQQLIAHYLRAGVSSRSALA